MKKGKLKITFSSYPQIDCSSQVLISGYTGDEDVPESELDKVIDFFQKNLNTIEFLGIFHLNDLSQTTFLTEHFIKSNMVTLQKVFTEQ